MELGELLAEADVVSLHLPLGPDTAGLVDVRKLPVPAGLDVFTAEPLPPGHPLLALKRLRGGLPLLNRVA